MFDAIKSFIADLASSDGHSGGLGDDDFTVNGPMGAPLTLNGGPGTDSLLFNGTPGDDVIILTDSTITGAGEGTRPGHGGSEPMSRPLPACPPS